jgi:hypothetical protein
MTDIYEGRNSLETVSKAARETVKNKHSWKIAVQKYLPVYERLLSNYE